VVSKGRGRPPVRVRFRRGVGDGPLKMTSPALTRARAPDILRAILPAQQLRQLGDVHGDSCK